MAEFKEISPNASASAKLTNWFENRFPTAFDAYRVHMSEYYAPKNFNFWYIFGSLALLVLVIQIVTGIFLVMHYKPDANLAFASVEYIMRDVPWGWLIRYMHSTGASAFFVVVYLHMFRGLIYGSYRKPRELVWIFGCAIFLCLMAEAFMGYLLPWGQMSYWGAQVIVNLFAAIPFIGPDLALLIRGDFVVGDATLNRFFSFHVIAVPLVLLGLVVALAWLLVWMLLHARIHFACLAVGDYGVGAVPPIAFQDEDVAGFRSAASPQDCECALAFASPDIGGDPEVGAQTHVSRSQRRIRRRAS